MTSGVGRDRISDFTTRLLLEFLCNFTERFTLDHVAPELRREFSVPRVAFNHEGYASLELKARNDSLQERKEALLAQLAAADEPPPLLHPCMADLYRSKVEELAAALQREDTRLEASEMLRGLIESIVLTPRDGQLGIELKGNLATMFTAAQNAKRSPETGDLCVPMKLGCGGRI